MSGRHGGAWPGLIHRRGADAGEWGGGPGGAHVFVPGLMGAGILLSAVILVSDGVRRLFPSRGIRRRLNVIRGVRRIVVDIGRAANMAIEERNLVFRERRSKWAYLSTAVAALPLAAFGAWWGLHAYGSAASSLHGNAMAIFYGMCVAALLGGIGLLALTLFAAPSGSGRGVEWLVQRTSFGRLVAPPSGVVDRARLLIPDLDKGARS